MRAWDATHTIRASVLRDIMCGWLAPDPDPHGLQLRGAHIAGRLDLQNITSSVALKLRDCLLDKGLVARDAQLPTLVLDGCRIEHPSQSPLDAERCTATALSLRGATIAGECEAGAVNVRGARIGQLQCPGARIENTCGPALNAEGLETNQGVFLGSLEAIGCGETGAVRLYGAHVGGQLGCAGASIRNGSGPALYADRLQADHVHLSNFDAVGTGQDGAVRFYGAHLGRLECHGAKIRNDSGPAMNAFRLQIDQEVFLGDRFSATGAGEFGAVEFAGARIRGHLNCDGAKMYNKCGSALYAPSLQVDQNLFLRSLDAVGNSDDGAVHFAGAHIGGQLHCAGATICNDSGPALNAYNLQVDQDLSLSDGFQAVGASPSTDVRGAVLDLKGARIGGTLTFHQTRLERGCPAVRRT
jgi:hypothetical protein